MQQVLYLPVITNGSEDTLAIFHQTNVKGDLYRLLARTLVVALTAKLVDAFDPSSVLKGVGVL